ncbi:MAG: class II aldolase/adducin family protein [Gammaproteobacteria bacterium]|nr:class II aldolase/adducin family protein [Gammaproteobacteria bacterium]
MNEKEGVIKYQLDYTQGPPVAIGTIREINAWRRIFFLLGIIGQEPSRYGGYGFGNVSCRLKPDGDAFLISGTQTAHLPEPGPEHYAIVTACDPLRNHIAAQGPVKPSSEALTHGALYRADQSIAYVFHVHSPDIWRQASRLALPATARNVSYGTPEMASEIERLLTDADARQKQIIVMGGHEDGVIAFGASAEKTGQTLVRYFSLALQGRA